MMKKMEVAAVLKEQLPEKKKRKEGEASSAEGSLMDQGPSNSCHRGTVRSLGISGKPTGGGS